MRSKPPFHSIRPSSPSVGGVNAAGHVNAVLRQAMSLGLGAQQPPQETGGRIRSVSDGDVLAGHLEGERYSSNHRARHRLSSQCGDRSRVCFQEPQQVDDRSGGLHGSGLVLREGAWTTAQQLTGLDLCEAETFANCANLLGSDFGFFLPHFVTILMSKILYHHYGHLFMEESTPVQPWATPPRDGAA